MTDYRERLERLESPDDNTATIEALRQRMRRVRQEDNLLDEGAKLWMDLVISGLR